MKQPEIAGMSQKLHHKKRHRRKRHRCFKIVNKAIKDFKSPNFVYLIGL